MCTFIHLEENVRRCRWWEHSLENRWKQVFPAAAVGCQGALVASVCRCTVFMWWRLKKKTFSLCEHEFIPEQLSLWKCPEKSTPHTHTHTHTHGCTVHCDTPVNRTTALTERCLSDCCFTPHDWTHSTLSVSRVLEASCWLDGSSSANHTFLILYFNAAVNRDFSHIWWSGRLSTVRETDNSVHRCSFDDNNYNNNNHCQQMMSSSVSITFTRPPEMNDQPETHSTFIHWSLRIKSHMMSRPQNRLPANQPTN